MLEIFVFVEVFVFVFENGYTFWIRKKKANEMNLSLHYSAKTESACYFNPHKLPFLGTFSQGGGQCSTTTEIVRNF